MQQRQDVAHGGGWTWRGQCWRGTTSRTVRRTPDLKRWERAGRRNGGPGGGGRWGGRLPWWVGVGGCSKAEESSRKWRRRPK